MYLDGDLIVPSQVSILDIYCLSNFENGFAIPMDNSFFDSFFKNENGEIVIAQPPNTALSIWIGATVLKYVLAEDPINMTLESIAFVAIVVWSLQELLDGVNNFRRSLGLIVLISVLASKLNSIFI